MRLSGWIKDFIVASGIPVMVWQGGTVSSPLLAVGSALVYGPAIALNAALGNEFVVTVTDAVAFAFSAPLFNGVALSATIPGFNQTITIRIRNASGGAHGAGTFNAIFKTAGAVPAIADTNSRVFQFRWNGTNWVETFRSAADIAN